MDGDSILIKRMRRGEEGAFDQFVRQYYEDILRYCACHCYDREEAKDLTQDTFLRFFDGFSRYDHRGRAKNYLYTIAGNLCRNHYRAARAQAALEEDPPAGQTEEELSTRITVRMALDRLPEELREVVILYYYQGMKQREIARVLNIGLPLVKYRLKKAKERLEELLRGEG